MYDLNNFCNIIASLRRQKGWTQAVFADKLGISPQSISKWECGIGFPDVTLFPIIADVLSVPIGVLFGENYREETMTLEYNAEFEVCQDIKVSLGNICRVEYIDGIRDKSLVHVEGDPTFVRFFSVEKDAGGLLVTIKNPTGSAFIWKAYDREGYDGENLVQIFTGCADSNVITHNYLNLVAETTQNQSGNHQVTCYYATDEEIKAFLTKT